MRRLLLVLVASSLVVPGCAWIRGWGADVEVLEPPELRDAVADSVRAAVARYDD